MNIETENDKLRFVVLFHEYTPGDHRKDHWDLMLEHDGQLLTWALSELPRPGRSIVATTLDDHRIEYLELEGSISHDRGSVSRVFSGKYSWKLETVKHIAILTMDNVTWEAEFAPFDGDQVMVSLSEIPQT